MAYEWFGMKERLRDTKNTVVSHFIHTTPSTIPNVFRPLFGVLLLLFILGGWHLNSSDSPTIIEDSLKNDYYFWEKNGTDGSLRQRLAEYVWYNSSGRWGRNIVQSWHTRLDDTDIYKSWEKHKDDFNHIFYLNADQEKCIRNITSHNLHDVELAYFQLLTKAILRADLFRYLAIWAVGGIWADADTWLRRPFNEWLSMASDSTHTSKIAKLESKVGMIVGIEYEDSQNLVQYVFAAKQGHPVLLELIADIVEKAPKIAISIDRKEFHSGEVLHTTGPSRFTQVVQSWIKKRWDPDFKASTDWKNLRSPKLFGDILVLPQWAFGGNQPYRPDSPDDKPGSHDDRTCVQHEYRYSWSKFDTDEDIK
jgi:mannosyltransferase OCH1-like enzyme